MNEINANDIPKIVFIYGDDAPSIRIRLRDYKEALASEGTVPVIYQTMEEAEMDLMSCGLFSPDFCGIVNNAHDLLNSKTPSPVRRWNSIIETINGLDNKTHIIIAHPQLLTNKPGNDIKERLRESGAVIEEISFPEHMGKIDWAVKYAAKTGNTIKRSTASRILKAVENDADSASIIINMLGEALNDMSADEIEMAISEHPGVSQWQIANAVYRCDAEMLFKYRRSFEPNDSGLRTYLIEIRAALLDAMVYDNDPSASHRAFVSLKKAKNRRFGGNANIDMISKAMRISPLKNGWAKRKYEYINDVMKRIYTNGSSKITLSDIIAGLCTCDEKRAEAIERMHKEAREALSKKERELDAEKSRGA